MPVMMTHNNTQFKNNKRVVKVGMLMYDVLSYDKNFTWDKSKKIPMHKTISRQEVLKREPNIRATGLTGASIFYDCTSIFPERLTLAFIKSAVAYGAKVSNYTRIEGFLFNDRHEVTGVQAKDLLSGATHTLSGTITINCGGPWADILLGLAKSNSDSCVLRRSEGIHVITSKKLLSGRYVVGSMTPSGRHFFLIPWRNHTLIGTTDKPFTGNPDEYHVTRQSINELIAEVNASFGDGKLSFSDVLHAFGGLRPLVEDQTEETYVCSRRYEIFDNAEEGLNGLITVEGGKYTTSRKLAENCLKIVAAKLGRSLGKSRTDKQRLSGCAIPDLNTFLLDIKRNNPDFSADTLDYLSRNYGTECDAILKLARQDPSLAETLNADGEILAEVTYAIRNEMARTLSDIVMRRTGIGTLGNPSDEVLQRVAALAARELKWDAGKIKQEILVTTNLLKLPEA
jgi:glycerol-3-phosphate dehydrogenase